MVKSNGVNLTYGGCLYLYLFGPGVQEAIARDEPAWRDWMERTFTAPAAAQGS